MDDDIQFYRERIEYLENSLGWYHFVLELVSNLGSIHADTKHNRDAEHIFADSQKFIERIFPLSACAFLSIDEADANFELTYCEPAYERDDIQAYIDTLIDAGEFAWAINQNRPYRVPIDYHGNQVLLHVLATKSRIRGMFLGVMPQDSLTTDPGLRYLSIVLQNTSHALESAALYDIFLKQKENLEKTVQQHSQQLDYEHTHDLITGLPNRALFETQLTRALARNRRLNRYVAILILDVDMFKRINDTMGHDVGDQLLKAIAERLNLRLRNYDTASRIGIDYGNMELSHLGGDEFCVMLCDLKEQEDALNIVHRITESFGDAFMIAQKEIYITVSIGISISPTDGQEPGVMIENADLSMYHAKQEGRNTYQFYAKAMNEQTYEHLILSNNLRRAVDKQEFELYYQPKINIQTNTLVGFEALIRWVQDDNSIISPDKFIPLAEETGLIIPIGDWVIKTACQSLAELEKRGMPLSIAVNVSGRQFKVGDILNNISHALADSGANPALLEIELTESTLMHDIQKISDILSRLRETGIKVSVDDFGTGYSSLSYLKKLPINTLKIDRSFVNDVVTDPDDAAIVSAINALAHSLNMSVIAEGVETIAQLEFLRNLGCEQIQGYYFSKPLPFIELIPFIEAFQKSS